MIREIQNQSPLFQVGAVGGLSGSGTGSPSQGNCGLTFNPATVSITIPTNDTGSIAATTVVTSSIAQSVTFGACFPGGSGCGSCGSGSPPPACLGTPTITPSTYTFAGGDSVTILITVPYTNCLDNGVSTLLTVCAVTQTGCVTYMGGGPGQAGGSGSGGGVTTSNGQSFVLDVKPSSGGSWGGGASDTGIVTCVNHFNPGCGQGGCSAGLNFDFRIRSINFTGTVHITGALTGDFTVSAGQTLPIGGGGCTCSVGKNDAGCVYYHGAGACGAVECSCTATITGTGGSVSSSAFGVAYLISYYCL